MGVSTAADAAEGVVVATAPSRDRSFRPDVEGLRAVAVLLVVFYHAGLSHLSGGYVGVDVFFVISGFVITRVLLRERASRGTTSILGFYGRRCRRILPAATLVIVVTVAATYAVLGIVGGDATAIDGRWAAVFLSNFHFATTNTNYLNANRLPSPLQNFWSLSVEEQFYLLYPTFFLVLSRLKRASFDARLATGLVAVIVGSFALSVAQTSSNATAAYFSPFTRAWELALGGLVAVGATWLCKLPTSTSAALTWGGLGAIVWSAVFFNAQTPYPGSAVAVPVIGAGLVIAAGTAQPRHGAERVLRRAPFQWFGKLSYSLYLWHWPILILAAESEGKAALPFGENLWWLVVAMVAALISFRVVENPVRRSRYLSNHRLASIGMGVTLAVTAFLVATVLLHAEGGATGGSSSGATTPGSIATSQELNQLLSSAPRIQTLPADLTPPLSGVFFDEGLEVSQAGCWPSFGQASEHVCVLGDPHGTHTMVLYGDSHAGMWADALSDIARSSHWRVILLGKGSCPVNMLPYPNPSGWGTPGGEFAVCDQWHRFAIATINRLRPDLLIVTQEDLGTPVGRAYTRQQWQRALRSVLRSVMSPHTEKVVLGNIPHLHQSGPECLSRNTTDVQACSGPPNSQVVAYGAAERAAAAAVGGRYIDTTPWFCLRTCSPIVGRYEVYFDDGHVTRTYAHFLEGVLAEALQFPTPISSPVSTKSHSRTAIITPHTNASVSGVQLIDVRASDNAMIRRVEVRVSTPGASVVMVGNARPSLYGWLLYWDTADVPNGTYILHSVLYDADGKMASSPPVSVSVRN
jgi:peptidoglycan/LPS O-acetylase OafA/YrhL